MKYKERDVFRNVFVFLISLFRKLTFYSETKSYFQQQNKVSNSVIRWFFALQNLKSKNLPHLNLPIMKTFHLHLAASTTTSPLTTITNHNQPSTHNRYGYHTTPKKIQHQLHSCTPFHTSKTYTLFFIRTILSFWNG